jgi:hypothetical protein
MLASLAFGKHNITDQSWLLRRLKNMHNSLRDTPVYQEMMRMTREEALEIGQRKGLQQGQYQALHDAIKDVTLQRFPGLVILAEKKTTVIKDPAILRNILVKLSTAQSAQEIEAYLNQIPEDVV